MTIAFMHAPEEQTIYTTPPKGYARKGYSWLLKRNINGRRSGSRYFAEWLAPLLISKGLKRRVLEPCMFGHTDWDLFYLIHVDDFLAAGPLGRNQEMPEMLGQEMLLKIGDGELDEVRELLLT